MGPEWQTGIRVFRRLGGIFHRMTNSRRMKHMCFISYLQFGYRIRLKKREKGFVDTTSYFSFANLSYGLLVDVHFVCLRIFQMRQFSKYFIYGYLLIFANCP